KEVQMQAQRSFLGAMWFAGIGFVVMMAALAVMLGMDVHHYMNYPDKDFSGQHMFIGSLGLVGGVIIEIVAGVGFWLYLKTSRQYSYFHICLERTHRYLLAYKISMNLEEPKDRERSLHELICIIAQAPMNSHLHGDTKISESKPQQMRLSRI